MQDRWGRLAPLTGIVFAVLAVVGALAAGRYPDANASPTKIVAYYAMHRSEVKIASILFALAFLFVVWWAGSLRCYVRRTPAAEGLGSLVLAGGVLMGTGVMITAGVLYGLADHIHHLSPGAAQTLNFLSIELPLPVLVGAFLFETSSGLAILRGAMLPKWLGWAAILLAIVTLIPPAYEFALLGFVVWSTIVSIHIYVRSAPPAEVGQHPASS